MKTFRRKLAAPVVLLIFFAIGNLFAAEPGAGSGKRPSFAELFGDDVIARGKGVEVKRSQLEGAAVAYRANLAARGKQIPEDQRTITEAQLLERLIVTQLLAQRATEDDRKQARQLAEKFMEESKKGAPSEDAFYRQLKALSMTPEQFKKRVDEQSMAEAVIAREVKAKIEVTDADLKAFYEKGADVEVALLQAELDKLVKDPNSSADDVAKLKERIDLTRKDNLARLEQPERVKVQHVFFAGRDVKADRELTPEQSKVKRQMAEKVRARALAGEDFAKLVAENSEDRGLAETKGIYTFGKNDRFSEEFKSASFSLEPGKISDVVATPFGYHVIKLLERLPAQKIEFEKAAKDLKEFLTTQRMQRDMPEFFSKLRKEAGVEVLDAKYRIEMPKNIDPTKPD